MAKLQAPVGTQVLNGQFFMLMLYDLLFLKISYYKDSCITLEVVRTYLVAKTNPQLSKFMITTTQVGYTSSKRAVFHAHVI